MSTLSNREFMFSFTKSTELTLNIPTKRFISTMETEIISARNIVDLLLNEEFRSSICGPRIAASENEVYQQKSESFVYGWDC